MKRSGASAEGRGNHLDLLTNFGTGGTDAAGWSNTQVKPIKGGASKSKLQGRELNILAGEGGEISGVQFSPNKLVN